MSDLLIPKRFQGVQYRSVEIEELDPDEGTVLMRAAPYDVETQLDRELWESFAQGTFARAASAPHRVKLYHGHSTTPQGRLIGHAKLIEDRADGSWIRARFSNTPAAQEARELASDGTLDNCSVEFRPMAEHMTVTRAKDGIHVRHSRAHMLGIALVPHGAYADAVVASVRDDQDKAREALIARLRSLSA